MPYSQKTSKDAIKASERATRALDLRKGGATFKQIGQAMGMSEQRAHQIVTRELRRLNGHRAENADEVMRLEMERLDAMWLGVWQEAQHGDVSAINSCLRIMERRATMIGLDKPTKIQQETTLEIIPPPTVFPDAAAED